MDAKSGQRLGDFFPTFDVFDSLSCRLDFLENSSFFSLTEKDRLHTIHELLLQLIMEYSTPCFLLPSVMTFVGEVTQRKWVQEYTLSGFEFWMNHMSGISDAENYLVRGKIMGKYIPRDEYQVLFPVGMGKRFFGSHFVTAHSSPDLDTTVASFWGWIDAFSARVGSGLHIWNVPGGAPQSQVEMDLLFYTPFGRRCFDVLSKSRTTLAVSAADLAWHMGVRYTDVDTSHNTIEEDLGTYAVLVDAKGHYQGDWRRIDRERVRKVTMLLHACMRWFVSYFHTKITSFFSQSVVYKMDMQQLVDSLFAIPIVEADCIQEFTERQREKLQEYLVRVIGVDKGVQGTFGELWDQMDRFGLRDFAAFYQLFTSLPSSDLFDSSGQLREDRSRIFQYMEKIIVGLEGSIQSLRRYVERIGVAFSVHQKVFGPSAQMISYRSEIDEIRSKMGALSYLTVTISGDRGEEHPVGVVRAEDSVREILGSVSLRDFCNRDETKVPSYLEVISVVDHHKSHLQTNSAPVATIADAQSANALVAELAFRMHDRYSKVGVDTDTLHLRLQEHDASNPSASRVLQKLLHKSTLIQGQQPYFVDKSREFLEYLHYLYAILDDTDLLSKVSRRDLLCVASLLNRMKTLSSDREIEIVAFDDMAWDDNFLKKATQRILQNEDMYSLYQKIYLLKEKAVEKGITLCVHGESDLFFADTKVQNGCARVGQSKLFKKNFSVFSSYKTQIASIWCQEAAAFYAERPECDLHLYMISTIPSAEDMYEGFCHDHAHQDELWIWVPKQEQAIGHLKSFLHAFQRSAPMISSDVDLELFGEDASFFDRVFHESFKEVMHKQIIQSEKSPLPVAILRYRAGLLNSRKAMIAPYLPK